MPFIRYGNVIDVILRQGSESRLFRLTDVEAQPSLQPDHMSPYELTSSSPRFFKTSPDCMAVIVPLSELEFPLLCPLSTPICNQRLITYILRSLASTDVI